MFLSPFGFINLLSNSYHFLAGPRPVLKTLDTVFQNTDQHKAGE